MGFQRGGPSPCRLVWAQEAAPFPKCLWCCISAVDQDGAQRRPGRRARVPRGDSDTRIGSGVPQAMMALTSPAGRRLQADEGQLPSDESLLLGQCQCAMPALGSGCRLAASESDFRQPADYEGSATMCRHGFHGYGRRAAARPTRAHLVPGSCARTPLHASD